MLVEWEDSAQPISSWRYLNDVPALNVVECVSVGWMVGKNDSVIMLAPNIGDCKNGEGAQGSGFIRIPQAAITRMVKLEESISSDDLLSHPDLTRKQQVS
ncbi:hypothetical protein MNBD_GAMMA23-780 [hydrothermal vent metagenome]|uniref:Uncharacterized protein n=1 Tax=hydrothermal vent metagenome TaxID=652676 RepID=A0A3B1ARN9_9ZZZZ